MAEKTRYTDSELEEFREIINEKLRLARRAGIRFSKFLSS